MKRQHLWWCINEDYTRGNWLILIWTQLGKKLLFKMRTVQSWTIELLRVKVVEVHFWKLKNKVGYELDTMMSSHINCFLVFHTFYLIANKWKYGKIYRPNSSIFFYKLFLRLKEKKFEDVTQTTLPLMGSISHDIPLYKSASNRR